MSRVTALDSIQPSEIDNSEITSDLSKGYLDVPYFMPSMNSQMQKYSNNGSDNFMRSGNIGNMNFASYNGYVNTGMTDWSPRGNELSNYGYSGDSQRSAILNNSYRNSFAACLPYPQQTTDHWAPQTTIRQQNPYQPSTNNRLDYLQYNNISKFLDQSDSLSISNYSNNFGFHGPVATSASIFECQNKNDSAKLTDPKELSYFRTDDHISNQFNGMTLDNQNLAINKINTKGTVTSGNSVIGRNFSKNETSLSTIKPTVVATNKPQSWAAIASKPAKLQPKPKPKPNTGSNNQATKFKEKWDPLPQPGTFGQGVLKPPSSQGNISKTATSAVAQSGQQKESTSCIEPVVKTPEDLIAEEILNKLKAENDYNPKRLNLELRNARFFVIKSYSEDDIHRSIKYNTWCSTEHGNKRLDSAFKEQQSIGPVLLLFSVNGSGHFCGVAQMLSAIDYSKRANFWTQDKWKGKFKVKWIYAKDVPNISLRHIRLENNENKPVTNSRDTQEVPAEKGRQVLKIIMLYKHQTSIFDDFAHYEKRQQEAAREHRKRSEARSTDNQ